MKSLSSSHLYLTATGRLARRLRHEYRMHNLSRGKRGWESLHAMSLNDWLQVRWSESWPEETPAHLCRRLHLFLEIMRDLPPPASLMTDLPLCKLLDDTYATLIRHGLKPGSGLPSSPLVEWRRQICRCFKESLDSSGRFHPAELPFRAAQGIEEGALSCPDYITISGFDFPAPVESNLFRVLQNKSSFTTMNFPERVPDRLEAVALPSPEQEILYLIDRLIEDARTTPLHRIGIVVPSLDSYAHALEKGLNTITGKPPPPDAAWYNISLGKTVLSFPLIQAALFPLRMALDGITRENLLALFLSPYYPWGSVQKISRADLTWRKSQIDDGLKGLLKCLQDKAPEILKTLDNRKIHCLSKFFDTDFSLKRPLPLWLDEMENLWSNLNFPVLSDETDANAFHHMGDIVRDMRVHLDGMSVNGYDLFSWVCFLAAGEITQTSAPEEAGIQILGLIESRGHDFDRLYVLGMSDRSLPQPVRPLPFLDVAERKIILGGTPESQYSFAEKSFKRLLSSSPIMTLLRPEQADNEPLSPSPFWPSFETKAHVDLWNAPGPAWIRAGWLRSAFEGLNTAGSHEAVPFLTATSFERRTRSFPLPRSLSVSSLERAVTCPCLFFIEAILGIEPLRDPLTFLYSIERGERLHRVLSSFTREARKKNLYIGAEKEEAVGLLTECVDRVLYDVADQPRWLVERRLWLEEGGLLLKWLELETEKRDKGWMVLSEEIPFKDLEITGFPFIVKGRIDRIDHHPDQGFICWDYKSGNHPGKNDVLFRLTAPQLPVYLMALRKGAASGMARFDEHTPLSAGYLQLKSAFEIRETIMGGTDFDWEDHLVEWVRLFNEMGIVLQRGDFPLGPYPFSRSDKSSGICQTCPYLMLCEKGLTQDSFEKGEEDAS